MRKVHRNLCSDVVQRSCYLNDPDVHHHIYDDDLRVDYYDNPRHDNFYWSHRDQYDAGNDHDHQWDPDHHDYGGRPNGDDDVPHDHIHRCSRPVSSPRRTRHNGYPGTIRSECRRDVGIIHEPGYE